MPCASRAKPAQRSQSTQNPLPTLMIDRRQLRNPFGKQVERGDRRILNRAKHRTVAMGVQLFKRPDNRGVADREAEAPAKPY